MAETWRYDAFISYRHTELDSFVAKNLHRQLESFKLPGNVARRLKEGEEGAKMRITRVFRDQEELPLVSNLADPIMEALEKSEFLIVICSPRLNESMWCKKEIETYVNLYGREHILLVLAEGEPEESFPEALLYKEIEELAEDGSIRKKRVPMEPLAADVRGGTPAEIRKKIKSEMLRLAAPMFQCSYDDLKQRHRERKMKKIVAASLAGSGICLLFGLVSTTMALQIRRQNMQITAQTEEITKQAARIEKQYEEALKNRCISQAKEARNLLEEGDRIGAIKTALEVFPGGGEAAVPYTARAAYALSDSLRLYENGTQVLPDRIIEADTTIDFMKISPEGSRILTVDDFGMLCVWDGNSGGRLASFLLSENLYRNEEKTVFLDEDTFLYPSETGVDCYDILTGAAAYQTSCEGLYGLCYAKETDRAVITTEYGFLALEGRSGRVVAEGSLPESKTEGERMKIKDGAVINEDGTLFALAASSEGCHIIAVYETASGELYRKYAVAYSNVDCMRFAGDVLYVIDNEEFDSSGGVWKNDSGGILYACDLAENDKFLWTYESETQWLYDISVSTKEGSCYMLCSSYDNAVVLDRRDGSYADSFFFGSEIIKMGNYLGTDAFFVFTRDGTWHYVNLEIMTDLVGTAFSNCTSNNVKMFGIGDGYYVTLPYSERRMTLYRMAFGSQLDALCETKERYAEAALSGDGEYLAASCYVDGYTVFLKMIETATGKTLWDFAEDAYCLGLGFCPEENAFMLATSDGVYLLDIQTGEQKAFYEKGDSLGSYFGTDESGRYALFRSSSMLYAWDLADGSTAYEIEAEELFTDNNAVALDPSMEYLAAAVKETGSLRLYGLDALRQGEKECLCELEGMNATYIESLFFGGGKEDGLRLYVVYKNHDVKTYRIDAESGGMYEEGMLQDLEEAVSCFIQPEDADYSILAGNTDAYLVEKGSGEITSQIHGFLAADGRKKCIYLTDGNCIYRAPVYDAESLKGEAERELSNSF